MNRRMPSLSLAALLVVTACGSQAVPATSTPAPQASPVATALPTGTPSSTPKVTPIPPSTPIPALIPQPLTPTGLDVAPDSARVDLAMPTFSNPTSVTNPLFPVSSQHSVLLLGVVDDKAFRTEVTLLPYTRIINWAGQRIEALVSQYVAFLDGQIHEVAYDYYAQDDAGNVWYLGEDVFNFADGAIVDTHGTWIAGIDGPGAMIMPAEPQVGDVYRPENIPGLVFEEVTIKSVGQTLDGPLGPIEGGLVVEELHMDGGTEDKTFAPGYGEFLTAGGGDVEALALAVPTDALDGPLPEPLATMVDASVGLIEQARAADWAAASGSLDAIRLAWEEIPAGMAPSSVRDVMDGWLTDLARAIDKRDAEAAQLAAIETARSGLDLQLRFRPVPEVELARLDLWAAQLRADAEAGDAAAVNAEFFAIDYVRDRIVNTISESDMASINSELETIYSAIGDGDMALVAELAASLRELVGGITF